MNHPEQSYLQGSDLYPELFKTLVSFMENNDAASLPGEIYHVPVTDLISDEEFEAIDASILNLFKKGPFIMFFGILFSHYYKIQRFKRKKNITKTFRYIYKYYLVYRSLKNKKYQVPNIHLKSFPWIFVSNELKLRLDGHHRSAVFKFLGEASIPARVLTPDSLKNKVLPDNLKMLLKEQTGPDSLGYEQYQMK